jgi:type IV pilus assembly protein PilB
MSAKEGAAAPLRAVPEGSTDPVPSNGLTPPHKKKAGSRFISDVIVEMGFLARERVETAVEEGKASGRSPEQVLLESGAITGDQLARAVAQRFGLDHVDLTIYKTDVTALNSITPQAARRLGAVPIGKDDNGTLMVAMSDPSNVLALDDLKLMTGSEVRPVVASPDDIAGLVGRMSRLRRRGRRGDRDRRGGARRGLGDPRVRDDAPVIKLVNSIIAQAVDEGASDIHFEPEGREMRVRFRVDGVLRETTQIPRRMIAGVISRVKIMADLDIAESACRRTAACRSPSRATRSTPAS